MRVLAFDPGFERLGVAVLEKENGREKCIHSECVRTSPTLAFEERLGALGKAAEALIKKFNPVAVALEKVYFEKNAKTAMQVAEVRGALTYIAARAGLPIFEYTPLQVKSAVTGNGKSDKGAVGRMVERLIALPKKKRLDDELDAIAIGITCLASVRLLAKTGPAISRYPHQRRK
jgi:crossover junction endodeoxyribonuclease RuvC